MPHLIETQSLSKSYFSDTMETRVLHEIDLVIKEGEFVAIMGPSGSGKSTLMHILGFLDSATKGCYLFRGRETGDLSDDARALIRAESVSFVFQSFNLLPRTSVKENVMLPLLYHPSIPAGEREARAMRAIEKVGIADRAEYLSNQISGGQQQRVAIARALVTDPEIIFADEPTGNLDSASGEQVMKILEGLNQEGKTIILVTHEHETAAHAQRIISLRDGRLERDEATSEPHP